jgi:hypothetical protein
MGPRQVHVGELLHGPQDEGWGAQYEALIRPAGGETYTAVAAALEQHPDAAFEEGMNQSMGSCTKAFLWDPCDRLHKTSV